MGLSNMKFYFKSNTVMIDKANFTSNLSLESNIFIKNISTSLAPLKSALKHSSNEKIISFVVDQVAPNGNVANVPCKLPEIAPETNQTPEIIGDKKEIQFSQCIYPIDKLGLHEICSAAPCYRGIVYFPECYIVLSHYITLNRLKIDTLSENDFKTWCSSVGHYATSKRFSQLKSVFEEMKSNHFQESFIINKIISKKNVHLTFSDCFYGENEGKLFRAFVVVGKRSCTVRNVLDCYCYNVKEKVSFIIKSECDYRNVMKSFDNNGKVELRSGMGLENMNSKGGVKKTGRLIQPIKKSPLPVKITPLNTIEVLNIHPNSVNEPKSHEDPRKSNTVFEPLMNYMRYEKCHTDVSSVCYNSSVLYNGHTYNLVSIISDSSHAYILCKNSHLNLSYSSENELHSIIMEDSLDELGQNQSNSTSTMKSLQKIMKIEIYESCIDKYYGVSLSQVPCGDFFVVQCTIGSQMSAKKSLLDEILFRHTVCGKIISKEYSMEPSNGYNLNLIVHLHGNERNIVNCSNELRIEGLTRNFKLIHPQTGKTFEEISKSIKEAFPKIEGKFQSEGKHV